MYPAAWHAPRGMPSCGLAETPTDSHTMSFDLTAYMDEKRAWVNAELDARMPPSDAPPADLHEAMRYAILSDGKRLRDVICLACADAAGGAPGAAAGPALALELLHGYTLIHPYDHLEVIAGQGTAALEMFEDLRSLDMLLVPCGGGGLLSGSAIAAKGMDPQCQVVGIEPKLADDATKSFHTRTLHCVKNPPTIADGTRTPSLGKFTFPLVLEYVDDMKTVSEAEIMEAVRFLFYRMKLVVEPSGALGIAALLSRGIQPKGRIGVIISGGNMNADTMTTILNA